MKKKELQYPWVGACLFFPHEMRWKIIITAPRLVSSRWAIRLRDQRPPSMMRMIARRSVWKPRRPAKDL